MTALRASGKEMFGPDRQGSSLLAIRPVDMTAEARHLGAFSGHAQVWAVSHTPSGLNAIVAIHDRTLGPALGGCRMWPYVSAGEAMTDALRLSRGMTFKAALAGLDFGGGKSVIIGDPRRDKTEVPMRAFGRLVGSLGGAYITGEDVDTSVQDMDWIALEAEHVIGTSATGGDPSPKTALGVLEGVRAAVRHRLDAGLEGTTVAVQGLGHVGYALAEVLSAEGARLIVADLDAGRIARAVDGLGALPASTDEVHAIAADVFAPCALGAIINDDSVSDLHCAVVAGSANNQLAEDRHGEALRSRGILYAPDYVINAGGVISAAMERFGEGAASATANKLVRAIGDTLAEIFARADPQAVSCNVIADEIAIQRIQARREDRQES